ncbi:MAG TPA: acetyl-CoA hydrolase/transferase C-terminal domain-containing protein [Caulobacteraceae bacterium]
MTPQLKQAGRAVDFLPLCYADILAHLQNATIDAALFMVAPPDEDGLCSFGPTVDFLAELWPQIPVRIAHINPRMPRTHGHRGIPFSQITAFVEADAPLLGSPSPSASDPIAKAIGANIAPFVKDGATLQTGLGKIPDAALRALVDRRDLRIHSGLIGDAVLGLQAAGALAGGAAVVAGVAIGSRDLYAAISAPVYAFRPVSYTHDARVLGAISDVVAINSALEVDLFGQAYAELGPTGLMSGPGGATDFARGVRAAGGLRIVALPSEAAGGSVSRIKSPDEAIGPVSLGRMDTDVVVTEHGVADLRGLGHAARALALTAIAAPQHRAILCERWAAYTSCF